MSEDELLEVGYRGRNLEDVLPHLGILRATKVVKPNGDYNIKPVNRADRQRICETIAGHTSTGTEEPANLEQITTAFDLAERQYRMMKALRRSTKEPSIVHSYSATYYLRDPNLAPAAFLHDFLEDTVKYEVSKRAEKSPETAIDILFRLYGGVQETIGESQARRVWELTDVPVMLAGNILDEVERRAALVDTDPEQTLEDITREIVERVRGYTMDNIEASDERAQVLDNLNAIEWYFTAHLRIDPWDQKFKMKDVGTNPSYEAAVEEVKQRLYDHYIETLSENPELLLIKMADALHNARTIQLSPEDSRRILSRKISHIVYTAQNRLIDREGEMQINEDEHSFNFVGLFITLMDELFKQYEKETDRLHENPESVGAPMANEYLMAAKEYFGRVELDGKDLYKAYVRRLLAEDDGTPEQRAKRIDMEFRDQIGAFSPKDPDTYALTRLSRSSELIRAYVASAETHEQDNVGNPLFKHLVSVHRAYCLMLQAQLNTEQRLNLFNGITDSPKLTQRLDRLTDYELPSSLQDFR